MPLTPQQILDAEADLLDLGDIVNGPDDMMVHTRTGGDVPTIKKVLAPYLDVADAVTAAEAAAAAAVPAAAEATAAAALVTGVTGSINPSTSDPGRLVEFLGHLDAIFTYVTTDMVWHVVSIVSKLGFGVGNSGRRIADYFAPAVGLAVTDEDGRAYFEAGVNGMRVKSATMDTLNGRLASAIPSLLGAVPLMFSAATRYLIALYGQSLAGGQGATTSPTSNTGPAVLTTDQPYGNKQFHGGVRPDDVNGYGSHNYDFTSLIPHVESTIGVVTNGGGETPLGAMQAMIFQLLNAYGITPIDSPFKTISFALSYGETPVAAFRHGGGGFTTLTDAITAAKTLSGGENVQMPVALWMQGESGQFDDGYIAQLTGLAGEIDSYGRAILTDQPSTTPIELFTYQLDIARSSHWYTEAQRLSPLVRIVGPMYPIEGAGQRGANFDLVHRSARGYQMYGAQCGVAWFCHVVLKRPWRPLQLSYDARGALRCRVDGNDLIVRYDVPHGGQLAFDVPLMTVPGMRSEAMQKGFYLFNSSAAEKPLKAVRIEGPDEVRLVGASPANGDVLRIGYKDPTDGGAPSAMVNLRDCQGDVIKFDDGGGFPVHNWALVQEHTLTTAELT